MRLFQLRGGNERRIDCTTSQRLSRVGMAARIRNDAEVLFQNHPNTRITSYNVCYTKLLRGKPLDAGAQGADTAHDQVDPDASLRGLVT